MSYFQLIPDEMVESIVLRLDDESLKNILEVFKNTPVINNNIGKLYSNEQFFKKVVKIRYPLLFNIFSELVSSKIKWIDIWVAMANAKELLNIAEKNKDINGISFKIGTIDILNSIGAEEIPDILYRALFKYYFSEDYDKLVNIVERWDILYQFYRVAYYQYDIQVGSDSEDWSVFGYFDFFSDSLPILLRNFYIIKTIIENRIIANYIYDNVEFIEDHTYSDDVYDFIKNAINNNPEFKNKEVVETININMGELLNMLINFKRSKEDEDTTETEIIIPQRSSKK